MSLKEQAVYLSTYKPVNEYQVCKIPIELMDFLGIKMEEVIYIDINGRGLLCKAIPILPTFCKNNYQVLASYHMMNNISHLKDFNCEEEVKLYLKNITPIPFIIDIDEIDISIIATSVDDIINMKKYLNQFKEDVQLLLKSYLVMNTSIVNCISNPLAKLIGISYIIVNHIKVVNPKAYEKAKYAGRVSSNTKINLKKIESEERHFNLIENKSLLGGLDTVLEDLKKLVSDRWSKKRYNCSSSGVLLIGPPGCGKSSLVRQLCFETQACFVPTAGAELQSPYEGETLQNLDKVARKTCSLSREGPCIFFIDEIDSIGITRQKDSTADDIELTSLLVSILDECKKYPSLLVIAATNRPFVLDKSIRTSGRLELEILLSAPTVEERKCILKIYSKDLLHDNKSAICTVASATPGFVGADLKHLCEKAREHYALSKNDLLSSNPVTTAMEMVRLCQSITPSIHKSLQFITQKPNPTPVGGLDEVKKQLDLVLANQMKFAKYFKQFKLKKPKGILFYGPRGCGKTRLVWLLASQRGYSFISANSSHLLSPYVGESERRVAALFHSARLAQPSIIFIDEIDGIFGSRETAGKGVRVNLLTELLQAMDGADIGATSRQGSTRIKNEITRIQDDILVCAATNHPEKLDSALLRPGRCDHLIYVPPPDLEARLDILKLKTSKLIMDQELLSEIASKSDGWTGSQLENLISMVIIQSILAKNFNEETNEIFIPREILMKEFEEFSPSLKNKDLKAFEEFERKCN